MGGQLRETSASLEVKEEAGTGSHTSGLCCPRHYHFSLSFPLSDFIKESVAPSSGCLTVSRALAFLSLGSTTTMCIAQ